MKKIVYSGMIIAAYITIVYSTSAISFGAFQIRFATGMYALAYIAPWTCFPLAVANGLSNFLWGGLGILDTMGGFFVGLLTTFALVIAKKVNTPPLINGY